MLHFQVKAQTHTKRNFTVTSEANATVNQTLRIERIKRKSQTKSGTKIYCSRDWYVRLMRNGVRRWIKLGPDKDKAAKRALDLINRADAFGIASGLAVQQAAATPTGHAVTIGELVDLVLVNAALFEKASPNTVRNYAASLMLVLREVVGDTAKRKVSDEEVRDLPATILTEQLVMSFIPLRTKPPTGALVGAKLDSAKRTANRHLRNARALLNPAVTARLRAVGHQVPDFTAFRSAPLAQGTRTIFRLPEPRVVAQVACAIRAELRSRSDPSYYLAAILALHAGLRRGEICHARWDWISLGKRPRIVIDRDLEFTPKKDRGRTVRISPWLAKELSNFRPVTAEGRDYLLPGASRSALYWQLNELADWLRLKGVKTEKPIHELRKWMGAYFAGTYGLTAAQRQLGHTTPLITNDFYAGIDHFNKGLGAIWSKPETSDDLTTVMEAVAAADSEEDDSGDPFGFKPEIRW